MSHFRQVSWSTDKPFYLCLNCDFEGLKSIHHSLMNAWLDRVVVSRKDRGMVIIEGKIED